jgi:hypothetical protein
MNQQRSLLESKARWLENKEFLFSVVQAAEKLGIEPRWAWSLDLCFTGDAARLAEVVRMLRVRGWKSTSKRPKETDAGWTAWFKHEKTEVEVWLSFTSSICRRVQVGTKLVEQPVYEVRCGEAAEPSPAADSSAVVIPF